MLRTSSRVSWPTSANGDINCMELPTTEKRDLLLSKKGTLKLTYAWRRLSPFKNVQGYDIVRTESIRGLHNFSDYCPLRAIIFRGWEAILKSEKIHWPPDHSLSCSLTITMSILTRSFLGQLVVTRNSVRNRTNLIQELLLWEHCRYRLCSSTFLWVRFDQTWPSR